MRRISTLFCASLPPTAVEAAGAAGENRGCCRISVANRRRHRCSCQVARAVVVGAGAAAAAAATWVHLRLCGTEVRKKVGRDPEQGKDSVRVFPSSTRARVLERTSFVRTYQRVGGACCVAWQEEHRAPNGTCSRADGGWGVSHILPGVDCS